MGVKSAAALAKLDAVEAEMRRIGFWDEKPPDLQAQVKAGKIKTYLDAPTFELWLQCLFYRTPAKPRAKMSSQRRATSG